MNDKLKDLYKSVILRHDSKPYHFEKKESAGNVVYANNAICGDRFNIFFEINNGIITDIYFHGFGCAISKASTSVLVKKIENQPIEKAKSIIELFLKTVTTVEEENDADEEMNAFSAAKDFPGRMNCATLTWNEMRDKLLGIRIQESGVGK